MFKSFHLSSPVAALKHSSDVQIHFASQTVTERQHWYFPSGLLLKNLMPTGYWQGLCMTVCCHLLPQTYISMNNVCITGFPKAFACQIRAVPTSTLLSKGPNFKTQLSVMLGDLTRICKQAYISIHWSALYWKAHVNEGFDFSCGQQRIFLKEASPVWTVIWRVPFGFYS